MHGPAVQGLASFGLTRPELLGAGLSHDAVDRLYRGLYVYTIGFFDVMQVCSHQEFIVSQLSLFVFVPSGSGIMDHHWVTLGSRGFHFVWIICVLLVTHTTASCNPVSWDPATCNAAIGDPAF